MFKDDESLLEHSKSPGLAKYAQTLNEFVDFSFELYGILKEETKAAYRATGIPVKFFNTKLGYTRFT